MWIVILSNITCIFDMAVIYGSLSLPMYVVPIITNRYTFGCIRCNLTWLKVLLTCTYRQYFFHVIRFSQTNKTNRHDLTEQIQRISLVKCLPFGEPAFSPRLFVCFLLVFCRVLVLNRCLTVYCFGDRCLSYIFPLSFSYSFVCHSSIYYFWLPI